MAFLYKGKPGRANIHIDCGSSQANPGMKADARR
jgi:hypothetical protein